MHTDLFPCTVHNSYSRSFHSVTLENDHMYSLCQYDHTISITYSHLMDELTCSLESWYSLLFS